jgi:hypothetical protein
MGDESIDTVISHIDMGCLVTLEEGPAPDVALDGERGGVAEEERGAVGS